MNAARNARRQVDYRALGGRIAPIHARHDRLLGTAHVRAAADVCIGPQLLDHVNPKPQAGLGEFEILGANAEGVLSSSAVVSLLDPGHDRDAELVAGVPVLPVQDVPLPQGEEAFHGGVVACCADSAHRSNHVVPVDRTDEFS